MNQDYLRTFITLAQYQNFSDAAAALFISQSSLSNRIQKIETSVGTTLINRTSRRFQLTDAGKIYVAYAKKIVELHDECQIQINNLGDHPQTLRVSGIPSMSRYGITQKIVVFSQVTGIQCDISMKRSGESEHLIMADQCEFAFIKNLVNTTRLNHRLFAKDHLVAVLPKTHPLSHRDSLQLNELAGENFMLEPLNSRPYQLIMNLCAEVGFTPHVGYTDSQMENIVDLVGNGLGISLLMSQIVPSSNRVATVPIKPCVDARIELCWRRGRQLSANELRFVNSMLS